MLKLPTVICCLALASLATARASTPADDGVVHTSRTEFTIPFDVDLSLPDDQRPLAVQLFVSTDRGQHWLLVEQISTGREGFRFQAPMLGEYWFVTRGVSPTGHSQPLDGAEPELRVAVEASTQVEEITNIETSPKVAAPAEIVASHTVALPLSSVPPGAALRMLNTLAFDLDYDVPNLTRSATDSVELWRTTDGGHSWQLHDRDVDRRSPMRVRVEDEGLYGFTLVIVAADGSSGAQPVADESPQFWVGIDRTQPTARLTTAETHASDADHVALTVRWEADDARLAAEPIALYYGESLEGPWTPLALSVSNQGQHTCPLPADVPNRVYLRLEARDEAGNVCQASSSDPISLGALIQGSHSSGVVTAARLYHVFH